MRYKGAAMMGRQSQRTTKLIRWIPFLLAIFIPTLLLAEPTLSGANYWGDSGNALIDGPDVSQLKDLLGGMAVSYPTIEPNFRARSEYWQDVSGNGSIDGPDLSILKDWLGGDYGDLSGNPALLENETATVTVTPGESVTLGARGKSGFNWYRAGWGLNFKIVSSTCAGAQLYGRDPAGSKTYILAGEVYEYTSDPPPLDDGYARVKVFVPGSCTAGQEIEIQVSVPADSYSGAPNNRHPDKLTAAENVTITVSGGSLSVLSVEVLPGSTNIEEGSTITFQAFCNLSNFTTVDCTESYGGIQTQWSGSGHLTQLDPPNVFQAGIGNGVGAVGAEYDDGGPVVQDGSTVYVWDLTAPDTSTTSNPTDPSDSRDATFTFICNEPGCNFWCNLDNQGFNYCSSPINYAGLSEGAHTFAVRAIDPAGNPDPTPAGFGWTIDLTAPETGINSHPTDPSDRTDPQFTFSASELGCTFNCKLDSGAWSLCASPKNYSGLSAGTHLFQTRATDPAGHPDPSPASFGWKIGDVWQELSTRNAPEPRIRHAAVWTGTEMIVWGGGYQTGGRYRPDLDQWTPTSTVNAPLAGRSLHTSVWTGTEMVIWGGWDEGTYDRTGASYAPATDSWSRTSMTNAPGVRYYHVAVWTGAVMIIWSGGGVTTGGRYDPATDSWTATSTANVPVYRVFCPAVWSGAEMIVWGGWPITNTGGRYNPATNSWTAISLTNAPQARLNHTGVWTGTELVVWGGEFFDTGFHPLSTGGRYNPSSNSWSPTSLVNAPAARYNHTAVWTAGAPVPVMIVWGGQQYGQLFADGGSYDPDSDVWTALNPQGSPSARTGHSAVWTGEAMIIWGGLDDLGQTNTGFKYWP